MNKIESVKMTENEAIEILRDTPIDIRSTREDDIHSLYAEAQNKAIEALEIADRLEQAKEELKDEYNSMNNWYMNKFDILQDYTECEKIALDFALSTMQTISYLLDSLTDMGGKENGK